MSSGQRQQSPAVHQSRLPSDGGMPLGVESNRCRRRFRLTCLPGCCFGLVLLLCLAQNGLNGHAAEIRLKNGTMLRGTMLVTNAMAEPPVGIAGMQAGADAPGPPVPRMIARVENNWQRFYFPVLQDSREKPTIVAPNPVVFELTEPRKQAKSQTVTGFGGMLSVEPFDEFGHRRVTIGTQAKPIHVIQAITAIAPDHVLVESLNVHWKFGMALKAIPKETIESLLHKHIKRDDVVARFALIRFYAEAEYFLEAFQELEAIGKDFPDRKDLVEKSQTDLMNYFGREILRKLSQRKRAAQHQLAETFAKELLTKQLSGSVQQDVQEYVRTYEQARQSIERVKLQLGEWQSKLDPTREKQVQSMRSEINEQLDLETLPRLDAFIKAEIDPQFDASQHMALAISGWVMGAANAVPDLDQSIRLWETRNTALEYLRSDDPVADAELMDKLKSSENVSPSAVLKLVAQLPPSLDATGIEPGQPTLVEVTEGNPLRYWVVLPMEYNVHHRYPIVAVLRPTHRNCEQTTLAWSGDTNDADLGFHRGYIVIAPEYAEKGTTEYSHGAPAHKAVLDCLVDARRRFAVDSDRVFLAGHGMGADAAYDIGMAHPDEFAGVTPMGGNAINYCAFNYENGSFTAWYAVGKGYDVNGNRDPTSNNVIDRIMKRGAKYDFTLIEYLGRNGENLIDEIPRILDWMDLHSRAPMPKKFKMTSLRKADNRFFWVTAKGLPRDYILPLPPGEQRSVTPMDIDVNITLGNSIVLKSPTENYELRLTPELVDFEKRLIVRVNSRIEFNDFLKPDAAAVLNELRLHGDRKRLPLTVITP